MASCLTSGILRSTAARISSLLTESSILLPSAVSADLWRLENVMFWIFALHDYEEGSGPYRSAMLLLDELKETAYCVADVVDECVYKVSQAKHDSNIDTSQIVSGGWKPNPTKVSSEPVISHELAHRLKEVLTELQEFNNEWDARLREESGYGLSTIIEKGWFPTVRDAWMLETTSLLTEPCIFGRNQEKEKISELLLKKDTEADPVSVLAIVGQAGVGKTALAQLVYKDPTISHNFDLQGWVNVSEDFCITTITRDILQSFTRKTSNSKNQTYLQRELVRELTGKSFFIVLDDVRHENATLWECFLAPFLYAQSGKIIVTTRDNSTAEFVQTMPNFKLKCLTYEDSWSMFKYIAFFLPDVHSQADLSEIGKRIVKRSGYLPLFVKAIASALQFESKKAKWADVLASDLWESSSSSDTNSSCLRICYECMPAMLKQCFLFLSMYPSGHIFFKEDLIRLWMSVGLLREELIEPRDVGSLFFDELLQRAMLQPAMGDNERNDGFHMHDLVRDFAISTAGKDFAVINHDCLHDSSPDVRYLSIIVSDLSQSFDLQPLIWWKNLRVIQIVKGGNRGNDGGVIIIFEDNLFEHLNKLRSLIIRDTQLEALPYSISNLKFLNYLDLTNTCVERLPESISHLYNLEALDLTNCPLKELPKGIKNLVNLEILNFQKSFCLCIPRGIGNLINLRSLTRFDVKRGNWHCAVSELEFLVNLKGELSIAGLSNLTSIVEAKEINLKTKSHLEALTLDWASEPSPCPHYTHAGSTSASLDDSNISEQVLQSLQPHTNLRELHIYKYRGSEFPSWLGDSSFYRLVKISLVGGEDRCQVLPTLGRLPYLKNLFIQSMWNIRRVRREFCSSAASISAFPSLEILEFGDMLSWIEWTGVHYRDFRICAFRTVRTYYIGREVKKLSTVLRCSFTCMVMLIMTMNLLTARSYQIKMTILIRSRCSSRYLVMLVLKI
ncbi:hypothetical protein LUZ60_005441 [Juncus effusus]|nr:hypothetical protein LUZ60_005441 [Juncus effusus]